VPTLKAIPSWNGYKLFLEKIWTEEKNATSNNSSDQNNVLYIILQYLNSYEEFDFSGTSNGGGVVNHTNGTVLHLALYGEKWAVVEKILDEWDGDINTTNSLGETPLHLATKLKCRNQLFDKLLSKANSEIEVDLWMCAVQLLYTGHYPKDHRRNLKSKCIWKRVQT
jgi:hypothetical protein